MKVLGEAGCVCGALVMAGLVLWVSGVSPKTYALQNADRAALTVAPVLRFVVAARKAVSLVIQFAVRATLRLVGVEVHQALTAEATEAQLRGAIELHPDRKSVV